MTVAQASLKEGTMLVSIGLPAAWPVSRPEIMIDSQLSDGALILGAVPTGQIEAVLVNEQRTVQHAAISPPLRLSGEQPVVITVLWADSRITLFELNKHDLLTETGEITLDFQPSPTTGVDLSKRSEQARMNRYSKLRNLPNDPRRKQLSDAEMYAALQGEVDQIEDLIAVIKQGKEAHLAGLASRIRLLVIGKTFGLLQHCAALTKAPLTIYTDRNPEELPPIADGLAILGCASGNPNPIYCNPVDLDVWLNFPALKVDEEIFSHRATIHQIGSTIGSHRDHGMPRSVQLLKLNRTQMGGVYRDIQRYVLEVADTVLTLCRHVLSQAGHHAQQ
jgi:hypothetical protein